MASTEAMDEPTAVEATPSSPPPRRRPPRRLAEEPVAEETPAEEPVAEPEPEAAAEEAPAEEPALADEPAAEALARGGAAAEPEPEAAAEAPTEVPTPADRACSRGEGRRGATRRTCAAIRPGSRSGSVCRAPSARRRGAAKREKATERKPIVRLPKPESELGRRQERQGTVVSDKGDKTIVVKVDDQGAPVPLQEGRPALEALPRARRAERRQARRRRPHRRDAPALEDEELAPGRDRRGRWVIAPPAVSSARARRARLGILSRAHAIQA